MNPEMFEQLAAPFSPDAISWRVGATSGDKTKGIALAYLDARDVMDRLDMVCGPAGWACSYSHATGKTVCDIAIRVVREPGGTAEWISKADGAGDTDVEAEKGALSDAFKRSAVRWGIGRYLYALPSPWVELEAAGRSYKIKQTEFAKLRKLLVSHTGITPKSSAEAARHKDFEFFKAQIEAAVDMESLGAIGRDIKAALPMLPAAHRDPLHDAYALRREALLNLGAEMDEGFRHAVGGNA